MQNSKFVTRKWRNYDGAKKITYNTEVLKSSTCDYNNAYILVRGDITVTAAHKIPVAFKNCEPFTRCITETDKSTIADAEDLDLNLKWH